MYSKKAVSKKPYTRRRAGRWARRPASSTHRRRRIGGGGDSSVPISKFVRAQMDAFDSSTDGVKIPDSNTIPSSALRVNDEFTFATLTGKDSQCMAFTPYLHRAAITATTGTGATWTWGNYDGDRSSKQASVEASFTLVRPVAHAIRISCPQAAGSITGFVHVCIVAPSDMGEVNWPFPTNLAGMNNSMFYQRVPISNLTQQTLTVQNKFLDVTAQRYTDPGGSPWASSSGAEFHNPGWGVILVACDGCPALTTVLNVESVIHIEAIPNSSGVLSASPAASYSLGDMQKVSHLAGQTPAAYLQSDRNTFFARALSVLGKNSVRATFGAAKGYFQSGTISGALRSGLNGLLTI